MYHQYFDFEFYRGQAWPDMPYGINPEFDSFRLFGPIVRKPQHKRRKWGPSNNAPHGTPPSVRRMSAACPVPAFRT
jgi:hypothetical protein